MNTKYLIVFESQMGWDNVGFRTTLFKQTLLHVFGLVQAFHLSLTLSMSQHKYQMV